MSINLRHHTRDRGVLFFHEKVDDVTRRSGLRPRIRARLLAAYAVTVLVALGTVIGHASNPTVPVEGGSYQGGQLGLPSTFLRWTLGTGFPSLGLVEHEPFAGISGPGAVGWFLAAVSPVIPGNPESILGTALPLLNGGWSAPASSPSPWPTVAALTPTLGTAQSTVLVLGSKPRVAIYETNSRDSFDSLVPSAASTGLPPVSQNQKETVTAVGIALAKALAAHGVGVVHSSAVNDAQGMLGAYIHSAQVAQSLMKSYPSIRYLLDVDRSTQNVGTVKIGGLLASRITLVVGTDNRLSNPGWAKNLAFAKSLGAALQYLYPGLVTAVVPSPDRLNQDLLPGGALTVEIGGPNSTMAEEKASSALLAQALASLTQGKAAPAPAR